MAKYRYNISVYSWSYITNKGTTARHNRIQTALSSKFFAISWICMFKTKVSSWVNPPLAPPVVSSYTLISLAEDNCIINNQPV